MLRSTQTRALTNKHPNSFRKTPDIPQQASHPHLAPPNVIRMWVLSADGRSGIQVRPKWKPLERTGGGQVAGELVLSPKHLCKHQGRTPQKALRATAPDVGNVSREASHRPQLKSTITKPHHVNKRNHHLWLRVSWMCKRERQKNYECVTSA